MKAFFLVLMLALGLTSFAGASPALKIVPNEKVCMVTDMYFGKTQIPVQHEGKTYYGCCNNCKQTLSQDPQARSAIDPVSGKSVDKAKAVIAAAEDNSVLYFENKKNFDKYLAKGAGSAAAPAQSK